MIFSELYDLKDYIVSQVKVNCIVGERDVGSDELPIILLVLEEEFNIYYMQSKLDVIDLPVTLKIISNKENEIRALEVFENALKKLDQFNKEKGHKFEGTGSPSYDEIKKTFEISVRYNLKLIIQDTE